MTTHYLIDHSYIEDDKTGFGEFGHLLAFNPGRRDAHLKLTFYFTDGEPATGEMIAHAGKSSESNYGKWPVKPGQRFALAVESDEPIMCQSTIGWNVTKNDYAPNAATQSPLGVRETAKSYCALTELNRNWYTADGIVIDMPRQMYVRESEWAILLNPNDAPAKVTLHLHYDDVLSHTVEVPARRVLWVFMDEIARKNSHYGVHFESTLPIAAQWLRTVNWNDRDEIMAYWDAPCVPGPLK